MANALLLWQQNWTPNGLVYRESWTEAFTLEQSGEIAATGEATLAGDLFLYESFDIGTGTMDATGRTLLSVPGFDYPTENVPFISGTLTPYGRATLTGNIDFEEPYFLDPPLEVNPIGRSTLAATVDYKINKSIGSGAMTTRGRLSFSTATLQHFTGVTKPLFNVTLPTGGRSTLTGDVVATTIKNVGSGQMDAAGRSTIVQTGFSVEAPAPFTHEIGAATIGLIGNPTIAGDTAWTDTPATELGSLTMDATGRSGLSVAQFFAGGFYSFGPTSIPAVGRATLSSRFSYPGVEYPDTEAVAVYEGFEMQEAIADLEGDDIVVG